MDCSDIYQLYYTLYVTDFSIYTQGTNKIITSISLSLNMTFWLNNLIGNYQNNSRNTFGRFDCGSELLNRR